MCVLADTVSCRQTASCGGAPSCRERGAEEGGFRVVGQTAMPRTHATRAPLSLPGVLLRSPKYSAADKGMQQAS